MDWRYNIKGGYEKLTNDPLQWKEGEDFHVALNRNGYRTITVFTGGDTISNSFSFDVFSRSGNHEEYPFIVSVDVNSNGYFVYVDDFPSLIELLSKLAPIAREASEKFKESLAEEEEKDRKAASRHG